MRHLRTGRSLRALATALIAALAFGAGSALAARAADPASTIYACVDNGSGIIRVVGPTGSCGSDEIRLTWNTQGPQGIPGPAGPQGPQGPQGAAGGTAATGATATAGPAEATGLVSLAGISGLQVVRVEYTPSGSGANLGASATCPTGKVALGGGARAIEVFGYQAGLIASHPIVDLKGTGLPTGWFGKASLQSGVVAAPGLVLVVNGPVQVWAICADI